MSSLKKAFYLSVVAIIGSSTAEPPAHAADTQTCYLISYSYGTGIASFEMTLTGSMDRPTYQQVMNSVQKDAATIGIQNSVTPIAVSPVTCDPSNGN
jgi:hypothetical protein